jgi:hypothetical protein
MVRATDAEFKYGYSDDDESARVSRGNVLEPQFNVRYRYALQRTQPPAR